MILPKNERRKATGQEKKVIWIYGAPFSGKTTRSEERRVGKECGS